MRPLTEVFEDLFRALGARSATYDVSVPHRVPLPIYPDGHPFDARPIPVLHAVGWFDNLAIVAMRDYMALSRKASWASLQYLTADSVDHENFHLRHAPIAEKDDDGVNDEALARMLTQYTEPALDFFDVFLKGIRDAGTLPKVSWHLGHEGYHEAPSWPPPGAREHHLYLGNIAAAADVGGQLTELAPVGYEAGEWAYDPENLVASSVRELDRAVDLSVRQAAGRVARRDRQDDRPWSERPGRRIRDLAGADRNGPHRVPAAPRAPVPPEHCQQRLP